MNDLLTFAKVAAVFAVVVWAMKRRAPMGLALSAGGIGIALLMGRSPAWIGAELAGGLDAVLFEEKTGEFVGVLGAVAAMAFVMERAGQIGLLTRSFQSLIRVPRVTIATLPALIGFMPMPGGVLFSAPMVEAGAKGSSMSSEDLALVNYWYRHVWEYCWPLYGGLILTAHLVHFEIGRLAFYFLPLCAAAILGGSLLLRGTTGAEIPAGGQRGRAAGTALVALLPIILIFALHAGAGLGLLPAALVGLAFASVWATGTRRITVGTWWRSVFVNRGVLGMAFMGYGAKAFGELMIRSGAIAGIASLFQSMDLPVVLLAAALPLTVGFFSGMTVVFVMTTFPILLAYPGVAERPLPVIALAFASGNAGVFLSPVHSCLVVSAAYFKVDLLRLMRRLLPPAAIVVAAGFVLLLAYGRL